MATAVLGSLVQPAEASLEPDACVEEKHVKASQALAAALEVPRLAIDQWNGIEVSVKRVEDRPGGKMLWFVAFERLPSQHGGARFVTLDECGTFRSLGYGR
jgi:hypothetical protein